MMKNTLYNRISSLIVVFIILISGCASVNDRKTEVSLNYTEEDVRLSEIQRINDLLKDEPLKALWRALIFNDEDVKNRCIEVCREKLDENIEQNNYIDAKTYCISLKTAGWDKASEYMKKIDSYYYSDVPGFSENNKKPGSITDCVNATVTIWVDKGLKLQNGSGYADIVVGSGFFIDKRGYIVTNNHVIEDLVNPKNEGYSRLYIKLLSDIDTKIPAKVIGYDPVLDLALLKTEIEPEFVLSLGSSKDLSVGDKISAIGAPVGLDGTLTSGIISSVDRKLLTLGSYFQVDAAVNSGNSGGPIIDENKNVQAVVFAGMISYEGLNFAIPVEYLKQDLPLLYRGEKTVHSWIGAYGHTKRHGNKKVGLDVQYVMPGSVSDFAGLKQGDVITAVDGKPVSTIEDFQYYFMGYSAGTVVTCDYLRDDEKKSTIIYLEQRSENPLLDIYNSDYYANSFIPFFGLQLIPTSSSRRKDFIVKSIIKGTAADELGFSENDPLTVFNLKLDKKNKYLIAQIYTKRKKKGFMDITLQMVSAFDNPYYF